MSVGDLRPLACQLGVITRSDGSAFLSQGKSSAVAGLYGPVEVKPSRENVDRMTVTVGVAARKLDRLEATSRESFLLDVIASSVMCSSHPRTTLSAQILELEDDGSNFALITNAMCLALIDSGVSMRHLFAGVNCAVLHGPSGADGPGEIIVDPTAKQLERCSSELFFVFENRRLELLSLQITKGTCSEQQIQECLRSAQEASKTVFQFYKETVQKKFSKELLDSSPNPK